MAKTLFLTGGRGMVGRNIQAHPAAARWTILAPTSDDLDLTDASAVRAFYREAQPDAVVHAAGKVGGIQANIADPVGFLDDNIQIGRNVIAEAHNAGVPTFINLASTCMYPAEAANPLSEELILTAPLEPTNEGYALAKIVATRLTQYIAAQSSDLHYRTLIPCNLYGLHDKFDPKHSHLVPAIIHKMHVAQTTGASEVEIWGDGTARREFMFAGDLADALHRALDQAETLPDVMNIGLGHDHSINDYYAAVAQMMGWEGSFTHDLSKPVGMKQKLTDTTRQTAWGWAPQTTLQDGLRQTHAHYREQL
ncbi:MAG: GDP-L-fucose synthase [Pseudomonadota bacterium]